MAYSKTLSTHRQLEALSRKPIGAADIEWLFSPTYDEGLTTNAVSTRVNNVRNEDSSLIESGDK
jgi:putative SOS response-associated peptidase YedK